ncbi:phage head-tail connector protein [Adlercreutzia sp. ZJ242]|uniref:phage head-tail connector protein n=1 Tax=Adlercreutzia sp. ZJ242 TaxID=2709409 RepID=UPI0013EDAD34|nr:phage head-tail connector protein [Adlercreutzia sp. ZJ242]
MTDEEMLSAVKMLVDDERFDKYVEHYLDIAKGAVVFRMWPYADAAWDDVPEKYHAQTVEIAVYLVNRRGAEGETSHSESGVSRSYESAGIPSSLLFGITPHAGVPR